MIVDVNEQSYFVDLKGSGEPVILLHGFTGTSKTWHDLMETDGYQWIAIDLPGHGKTIVREGKAMEDYIDELIEVINQLEIETFHLMGYSMGGRTALMLASRCPERIRSMTLVGASPGLIDESDKQERKKQDEKLASYIESKGIEAFVDYWEEIGLFQSQKKLDENLKQRIRQERLLQTEHGLALSLRTMGTGVMPSQWKRLSYITAPTLLVTGSEDEKFCRINEQMATLLPQCDHKIVEDAGHAVHVEKPETFVKIVSSFLNKAHSL